MQVIHKNQVRYLLQLILVYSKVRVLNWSARILLTYQRTVISTKPYFSRGFKRKSENCYLFIKLAVWDDIRKSLMVNDSVPVVNIEEKQLREAG